MSNPGQFAVWLGLIAICVSSICYAVLIARKENLFARNTARLTFIAFAILVTIASALLMHYILNHEFLYSYVARYSSRDLPLEYLVSSFWAGQEGSFLVWVLLGSWLGIFLMFKAGDMEPKVMLIYNLCNIFLAILLIKQSPFRTLPFPPPDGQGLNMLLQDPWMVIHPPVVFLGYAAFTIPFAYAVAGLWSREYDCWIKPALPWTVFSFVTLGAGIIIGAYWSYKVLGWGGYWAWDPVENASLLPWLAGIALMHSMILQQTLGKLRKTNFILAASSFVLVIYCTFLTRSGILADFSVHSFMDLGITGWLVVFMVVFLAISLGFLIARSKEIPVSEKGEGMSYFSREFGFIVAVILLCLSTVIIGLGTSAPLITRVLEKASKVSQEFYVTTNLPIAIIMLLLLSFVPLLTWGKNRFSRLFPKLKWAAAGSIISGVITLLNGYPGIGVLLLAVFAGASAGMNLFLALKLMRKRITISSAAISHLGVALMFLGIVASSTYDSSDKVALAQGAKESAMGYEIEFKGPQFSREGAGVRVHFPLEMQEGGAKFIAMPDIYSERRQDGQIQRYAHPHIQRGLVTDLYISPINFDPGKNKSAGDHVVLNKGKKTRFHDYEITFTGFDMSAMMGKMGRKDAKKVRVGANIEVSYKGQEPVELKPVFDPVKPESLESRVKLPGPKDSYITLVKIDANTKTVVLLYEGDGCTSQEAVEASPPVILVEVSLKPGMTLLWLGTILILLGGGIAIARRWPK
ncbi:MAG: hypothetical protein BA861_07850 [Desulfobacterales bacterium S3730MH5]|nr:MAG: hypothetical protein BA861_07850 [Desulfobacterales bacterium S3730MH5]OEU84978.1 MAG: hypothetical protein BA865_07505 [Desulfobacterales bacterium S5133MH4]